MIFKELSENDNSKNQVYLDDCVLIEKMGGGCEKGINTVYCNIVHRIAICICYRRH